MLPQRLLAVTLALVLGSCRVQGQTTFVFGKITCSLPSGVIPCASIVPTGTVAQNNQGAAFSLGGLPGGPTSPSVNLTDPEVTEPVQCGINDICDCQSIDVIDLDSLGAGLVECSGFIESNATAVAELGNITVETCRMNYTSLMEVTDNTTGTTSPQNVTVCFGEAALVEEECPNNTGVVVIIIICCVVLVTILALTAYWIRHENNKYNGGAQEPKFSVDAVVENKVT